MRPEKIFPTAPTQKQGMGNRLRIGDKVTIKGHSTEREVATYNPKLDAYTHKDVDGFYFHSQLVLV